MIPKVHNLLRYQPRHLLQALIRGIETATTPKNCTWFEASRGCRAKLSLRDRRSVWSHFHSDASQPLHVSAHYNGWGEYPNS